MSKLQAAEEDINYFNGFRNAVKVLNHTLQYFQQALDEVPEKQLKATMQAWRDSTQKDYEKIVNDMYLSMKEMYGMAMRVDADDQYYLNVQEDVDKN